MGITKQVKVVHQIHNRTVAGYKGYNIYQVKEVNPDWGKSGEFVLLSTGYYNNGSSLWLDIDHDLEKMPDSITTRINGYPVFILHAKPIVPEGYFSVRKTVPVTNLVEEFKGHSIARSKYNLYTVDHIVPDKGGRQDTLCRVFTENSCIMQGEEIAGKETIQLLKINQNDGYTYYLHKRDEAAYQARIWASIRAQR